MAQDDADVAIRAERFAQRVGAELADLPSAQRAQVLDDLAVHLSETNEDGISLLDQQGSPEEYAAELRMALVGTGPGPSLSRSRWWGIAVVAGVVVALIAAALVVLPRLSVGDDSTSTAPIQSQPAEPSPAFTVPNLLGLTQTEATVAIEASKLSLGRVTQMPSVSVPKGIVAATSPAAGSQVPSGSAVDITVSSGPG